MKLRACIIAIVILVLFESVAYVLSYSDIHPVLKLITVIGICYGIINWLEDYGIY